MYFPKVFRRRSLVAKAGLIVLVFVGFSLLWIPITDQTLGWLSQDSAQLTRLATYKGGLYIGIVALFLFWLVVSALESTRDEQTEVAAQDGGEFRAEMRSLLAPVALFLAAALVLAGAGVIIYKALRGQVERQALTELADLARLQAGQMDAWLQEIRSDTLIASRDPVLQGELLRLAKDSRLAGEVLPVLDQRMKTLQEAYHQDSFKIVDSRGQVIASSSGTELDAAERQALAQISGAGPLVLTWTPNSGKDPGADAHVSFCASINAPREARALGVLVFRTNLNSLLTHTLKNLQTYHSSIEMLLVCQQGEEVLYLNSTRFPERRVGRLPMARTELVGVQALRAGEGTFQGEDYQGVAAIAASRRLSSLPWVLLAKMDVEELSIPLQRLSMIYGGVALLFLVLASIALFVWRRREGAIVHAERQRIQAQNRLLEYRLEFLNQHANDIVLLVEPTGRIRYANDRAVEAYGYTRQQLQDMNMAELRAPDTLREFQAQMSTVMEGEALRFETSHRRKDGSLFSVEVSSRSLVMEESPCIQSIIRDISERKRAELALRESSERYHRLFDEAVEGIALVDVERNLLLECNQAFLRLIGRERSEVVDTPLARFHSPQHLAALRENIRIVMRRESAVGSIATYLLTGSGAEKAVEMKVNRVELGGQWVALAFFRDLTEEHQRQFERETTLTLLRILSEPNDTHELISNLTRFIQEWSGCEAVGIRLKEGEDFPYVETRGFPVEFVELENHLCTLDLEGQLVRDEVGHPVLECMCGNVLCRRFDPELPFFTGNGSFWSNSTTELLATTTEIDRQTRTRNRCNSEGYESIALIPLHSGQEVLGLLQLNDHAKDRFTPERIAFLEGIGDQIALALGKRKALADLEHSERRFRDLSEAAGEFLWETDARGYFSYMSERITDILGYTPAELLGRSPYAFIPAPESDRLKDLDSETRNFRNREVPLISKSGRTIWASITRVMKRDSQGNLIGFFGAGLDITERKEAEALLLQSEAQNQALINAIPDLIFTNRRDGEFLAVHATDPSLLYVPPENFPHRKPADVMPKPLADRFVRAFAEALDSGAVQELDYSLWVGGQDRHFEARVAPSVMGTVISIVRDITEQKRAEEALRANEANLDLALRSARMGVWIWDIEANRRHFDARVCQLLGLDCETFAGTQEEFLAVVEPEGREVIKAAWVKTFEENLPYEAEYRVRWKDDTVHVIHARGRLTRDDSGKPLKVNGTLWDVTEQRVAASALKASEEKYRRLFDTMKEGFALHAIITDAEGKASDYRFLEVNPAFEAMTGLSRDHWIGRTVLELIPETESYWIETYGHVALTGNSTRIENFSASLGRWYQAFAFCPSPGQFAVLTSDITDRKRAELALQRSERFLQEAQRVGGIGCYSLVIATGQWECSESLDEIFGIGPAYPRDVQGWLQLVAPASREAMASYLETLLRERTRFDHDYPIIRASDGEERWVSGLGELELDGEGRPVRMIGTIQDITDWKRAEMEIQGKNELLNLTGRMAKVGGWEFDPKTLKGTWTDEVARIHDLDSSAETSVDIGVRYYTPESKARIEAAITEAIGAGKPYDLELEIVSAKGIRRDVRTVCHPKVNERGEVVQIRGIFQDITERKAAEAAIRRMNEELETRVKERTAQLEATNQELEAFSYSVSHDLRGPLRGIDGFSRALMEDYRDRLDEDGKHYLDRIRNGTQRMGQLIDDLLKLSRINRSELGRTDIDLSALCGKVLDDLARANPERQVAVLIQPGVSVQADRRLLLVVLENLLGNAWKFTSKHEEARIEVGETASPEGERVIYLRDNGAGFDMAYVDKLFNAFQRLHGADEFEGTGIGLAIVQRIIRRHGGRVWAQAAPGKGATFFFTLPDRGDS